jgi:lipopolysaccharide biosynthesis glycosyltransferase
MVAGFNIYVVTGRSREREREGRSWGRKRANAAAEWGNAVEAKHSPKPKPMLAICAPTHSLKSWNSLRDTSLQTLLIPSIEHTVTAQELQDWDVRLYLGIDHDDAFWLQHHESLQHQPWLTIDRGFYEVPEHKVPFNEMGQHAYDDGAEYMVRVNDDTEFLTKGWITQGVEALRGFDPPNVGVVGPTCRQGNTDIMAHDMVHRTHLDIFDHYYPSVFSSWWIDDWITKVYEPGRSVQLKEWEVKHHTGKHGTRYKVQGHEEKLLAGEVAKGKERVAKWVGDSTQPRNRYALVTLTSPGYCERTLVLLGSFWRLGVNGVDVVVMSTVGVSAYDGDDALACRRIREMGGKWRVVARVPPPIGSKMPPNWATSLSRIRAFGMVEYDRVLYSDSDAYFRPTNHTFIDDFFRLDEAVIWTAVDQCAQPCGAKRHQGINGGLWSFKPSRYLLDTALERLTKPACLSGTEWRWSDQELLICLTDKEHTFQHAIWPAAVSMIPETWNKCTHEAVENAVRHVHFACAPKPPHTSDHRFYQEWNAIRAEIWRTPSKSKNVVQNEATWLSIVSRCPAANLPAQRLQELLGSMRHNAHHRVHPKIYLICTIAEVAQYSTLLRQTAGLHIVSTNQPAVSYGEMLRVASKLPGVKMLLNSDIQIGIGIESLRGIGSNEVVALSRHEPPVAACGPKDRRDLTNPNFWDQCERYQGSHDAFVFSMAVPANVQEQLNDVLPHQMGAENVVLYELKQIPGIVFSNPCRTVHITHKHCSAHRTHSRTASNRRNVNGRSAIVKPTTRLSANTIWLIATFPHTGSTWIRNMWDVSTGIVSESVFKEGKNDRQRDGIGSWGGKCGSRNFPGLEPDLSSVNSTLCSMVRLAKHEALLVKSHYPIIQHAGDGDKRVFANGVVLTKRSPEKWCDSHPEGTAMFPARLFRTTGDCVTDVQDGMRRLREFYVESGLPYIELDYDAMATSPIVARREFERLWAFTGVNTVRDGLSWFPVKVKNPIRPMPMPPPMVIGFTNVEYIPVAEKWCQTLQALTYHPTIIATDNQTWGHFSKTSCAVVRGCDWNAGDGLNKLWSCRLRTLLDFVEHGESVFLSDVDTIWGRYEDLGQFTAYDIYHGQGTTWPPEVYERQKWVANAGMGWWRATSYTVKVLKELVDRCGASCDDQRVLNEFYLDKRTSWTSSSSPRDAHVFQHSNHVAIWNKTFISRGIDIHCNAWIDAPLNAKTRTAKLASFQQSEEQCGVRINKLHLIRIPKAASSSL